MAPIVLPDEYGFVLLSAVSTVLVGSWLGMRITPFRKAAKIPYPYEYASYEQVTTASPASSAAMQQFNCAQRGHQNFNENHPSALAAILISGLRYPRVSAGLGLLWSVNRVLYAIGYTNGKPGGKGRYIGILWAIAHHVLVGYAGWTAWKLSFGVV